MDRKYIPAFKKILKDLTENRKIVRVNQALDQLSEMILPEGMTLREDARLFLVANFNFMVLLPWEEVNKTDFVQDNPHTLDDDIGKILKRAVKIAGDKRSKQVTARHILESVDKEY